MEPQVKTEKRQHKQQSLLKTAPHIAAVVGLALAGMATWWLAPAAPTLDAGLSQAQVVERQQAFQAAGDFLLAKVPASQQVIALRRLNLSQHDAKELQRDIEQGSVELVQLILWDDVAEDGDVIQVGSGGFQQVVRLANQPLHLTIPVTKGQGITITGVKDGQGGITIAAQSNGKPVPLPRLNVGQSVNLPVAGL